jgi:hypothetical protein
MKGILRNEIEHDNILGSTVKRSRFRWLLAMACIGGCLRASAGLNETLPTWHWAYSSIDELRLRGCFDSLLVMNRPYTRGEAARALLAIRSRETGTRTSMSPIDRKILARLEREFRPEMDAIKGREFTTAGLRFIESADGGSGFDTRIRNAARSRLFVPVDDRIAFFNALAVDPTVSSDSMYVGKKWRGMSVFTEQAAAVLALDHVGIKLGRDFLQWGAGRYGTLFFSDVSRPMDQIQLNVHYGSFRYSYVTAALDSWKAQMGIADTLGLNRIHRYVSAHRLEARLLNNRLQCAITEAVVYGGARRPADWRYLNPFLPYYAELVNDADAANMLGSVDAIAWPANGLEMYGSLLIDDVQVEKTGPGDLEPNEIGWIIGGRIGDPILISSTSLFWEYAKVTNRTYKTPTPWETFIHRNVPLGHPLGNDFDRLEIGISKWITGSFKAELTWSETRKGEGSLFTPFDEPWLACTVEQGYKEPFPTGVVEKRNEIGLSIQLVPSPLGGLEAEVLNRKVRNAAHVTGSNTDATAWHVGLWLNLEALLNIAP